AKDFFWIGEKGDRADKRKPGIDNLDRAIGLRDPDGQGWAALGAYAADPTAMAFPDRKDTICAPADPGFDAAAFEALLKTTGTEAEDWGFPLEQRIEIRAAAAPDADVIETVGGSFIWVAQEDNGNADDG